MTLQRREKVVLIVGGAVAGLLVLVLFVLTPLVERWCDLGSQLGPKLVLVKELRNLASQRETLLARRNRYIRSLGYLVEPEAPGTGKSNNSKPNPPKPRAASALSLAAYLDQTTKKAGVKIKNIKPKKLTASQKDRKYFRASTVQVTFDTKLQSLLKLLHALEKGERLIRIEDINLRRDLKKGDTVSVTLDIVGYVPQGRDP